MCDASSEVQLVDLRGFVPQWLLIGHDVHKALAAQAAVLSFVGLAAFDLLQLTGHTEAALVLPALLTALVLVHELVTADEKLRFTFGAILKLICGPAHLLGFIELLPLPLGLLLLSAAKPWAGNEAVEVGERAPFLSRLAL